MVRARLKKGNLGKCHVARELIQNDQAFKKMERILLLKVSKL